MGWRSKLGIGAFSAVGAINLAARTPQAIDRFRHSMIAGLHPTAVQPQGGGKFGTRTSGTLQSAALAGLRFSFKR